VPRVVPSKAPATPTYGPRGQKYLVRNKIYSAGDVPAVPCVLPDVPLRSQKAVQHYLNAFQDCLQRAWKPVVVRAGVKFRTSRVYAVHPGSKTACGTFREKDYAYYCAKDSGIYFDWADLVDYEEYDHVVAQVYAQGAMAHEFGHHVQELVGISTYYDDRWGETTGPAHLEPMRRHELQASCFGSAFLGANQASLDLYGARYAAYLSEASNGDDPPHVRDHGSSQNNTDRAAAAFSAESPSACNTWVTPAEWVS
jgi:predicted metalloprotease